MVPEHRIPEVGARIMDLQDPTRKMSTTGGSEEGTVYVLDEPKAIEKKIKRAVTDSADPPEIRRGPDKPGVTNLIDLLAACTGRTPDEVERSMAAARGYGDLKAATAEAVIAELAPLQERYAELRADEAALEAILARGAEQAREIASATLADVRAAMAVGPPEPERVRPSGAPSRTRRQPCARPRCLAADRRDRPRRHAALRRARAAAARPRARVRALQGRLRRARRLLSARHVPRRAARRLGGGALRPAARRAHRPGGDDGLRRRVRARGLDARARPRALLPGARRRGDVDRRPGVARRGVPRERRGEAIGLAIGAGIFGAQFGPVVGSIADWAGRGPTSRSSRRSASCSRRSRGASRRPPARRRRRRLAAAARARPRVPRRRVAHAAALAGLRCRGGARAAAARRARRGRAGDRRRVPRRGARRGRRQPARRPRRRPPRRAADRARRDVRRRGRRRAAGRARLVVALAALLVVASGGLGCLWAPGGSSVSLRAEVLGVDQGWAFALNNLGWAGGVALGAGAGGALGQLAGDGLPYGICAALLAATGLLAARWYGDAPA